MLVFEEKGTEKPLGAEKRSNKFNPHMTPNLGIICPEITLTFTLTLLLEIGNKCLNLMGHFVLGVYLVVCLVTWPLRESEPNHMPYPWFDDRLSEDGIVKQSAQFFE